MQENALPHAAVADQVPRRMQGTHRTANSSEKRKKADHQKESALAVSPTPHSPQSTLNPNLLAENQATLRTRVTLLRRPRRDIHSQAERHRILEDRPMHPLESHSQLPARLVVALFLCTAS